MSTLTREALLAMPADQYMSETQLKFFETLLQSELEEARQRHHDARETMQDRPTSRTSPTGPVPKKSAPTRCVRRSAMSSSAARSARPWSESTTAATAGVRKRASRSACSAFCCAPPPPCASKPNNGRRRASATTTRSAARRKEQT